MMESLKKSKDRYEKEVVLKKIDDINLRSILKDVGIGNVVKIYTTLGEVYTGEVYAIEVHMNCLVIQETLKHTTVKHGIRIFYSETIQSIEVLQSNKNKKPSIYEKETDTFAAIPLIARISEEDIKVLEEKNNLKAEKAIMKLGKNVSPEAQDIFDALCKTMPCDWIEQNIFVMDEVLILPPYGVEDCSSNNEQVLLRVKKVLEGEMKKIINKSSD